MEEGRATAEARDAMREMRRRFIHNKVIQPQEPVKDFPADLTKTFHIVSRFGSAACSVSRLSEAPDILFFGVSALLGITRLTHSTVRNRGVHPAMHSFAFDCLVATSQRGIGNKNEDLRSWNNAHKFDQLLLGCGA